MNVAFTLARVAQRDYHRAAVFHGKTQISTYGQLSDRASRIAGYLLNALSIPSGSRIGLFMTNIPEYLEVLYGIWYAGMVAVPINAKLHPREAAFILQDCGAEATFSCPKLADDMRGLGPEFPKNLHITYTAQYLKMLYFDPVAEPVQREIHDLAWLFYTSGTTGRPKGVMLSHSNLMAMISCYFSGVDAVQANDAVVYAAPISHGAGLYGLPFFLKGARHVVPLSSGFDSAELVELASYHRQVSMFAAPTMVSRLVDYVKTENVDTGGFKTIVFGGGPMYVENLRLALKVMGNKFAQIYGQGESPMTITSIPREFFDDTSHPRFEERLASVGTAQSLVEIKIANTEGVAMPVGTPGEIMVKGSTVMLGYWNNPEATEKAIKDGWLITGDIGCIDSDGFLTLRDRSKDVIISGGTNIYPREVEEALLTFSGIKEASVVGMPDADWGEVVVAFVVAEPGINLDLKRLDSHCLESIARFKRPKHYVTLEELPKNNYGKVLKTGLRALLEKSTSKTS